MGGFPASKVFVWKRLVLKTKTGAREPRAPANATVLEN